MKNILRASALVIVGTLAASIGFAQDTSSIQGTATVEFISPIDIQLVSNLSFGVLIADNNTTEFVVPPTGPSNVGSSRAWAAQYQVTGEPSSGFNVVLPESVYLTDSDSGRQVQVHSFATNLGEKAAFDETGFAELAVGATLKIGGLQKAGVYTGSYEITVAYN